MPWFDIIIIISSNTIRVLFLYRLSKELTGRIFDFLVKISFCIWNFSLSKEEMAGLAMRLESLWYGLFFFDYTIKIDILKLCFYISNIYSSVNKMKNYSPIIPPIYIMSSQMMAYAPDSSCTTCFFKFCFV